MISYRERVDAVKAAINNTRSIYDTIEASMYAKPENARSDKSKFGELCIEVITLHEREIDRAFPWAHPGYEHVCQALAEIVEEWED